MFSFKNKTIFILLKAISSTHESFFFFFVKYNFKRKATERKIYLELIYDGWYGKLPRVNTSGTVEGGEGWEELDNGARTIFIPLVFNEFKSIVNELAACKGCCCWESALTKHDNGTAIVGGYIEVGSGKQEFEALTCSTSSDDFNLGRLAGPLSIGISSRNILLW